MKVRITVKQGTDSDSKTVERKTVEELDDTIEVAQQISRISEHLTVMLLNGVSAADGKINQIFVFVS